MCLEQLLVGVGACCLPALYISHVYNLRERDNGKDVSNRHKLNIKKASVHKRRNTAMT